MKRTPMVASIGTLATRGWIRRSHASLRGHIQRMVRFLQDMQSTGLAASCWWRRGAVSRHHGVLYWLVQLGPHHTGWKVLEVVPSFPLYCQTAVSG